jgi:nucleotide-binding universal stress UspA family protein
MEKITTVLAVVEKSATGAAVLDKAVALARNFGARVELLIADPALTPEFASRCAMLGHDEVTLASVAREGESLQQLLARHLANNTPDLLIKAPSHGHGLLDWISPSHDRELAYSCGIPVLLAGARPWTNPPRFAVPVDVSDQDGLGMARGLLHTAGFLALGCHGNLDVLYSEREDKDDRIRMERAVKLAQLVREFYVGCERLQMFEGSPAQKLPPLIRARQYDVLILGSGRDSEPLFEATDGDVLIASTPVYRAGVGARAAESSTRQQVAHHAEQLV